MTHPKIASESIRPGDDTPEPFAARLGRPPINRWWLSSSLPARESSSGGLADLSNHPSLAMKHVHDAVAPLTAQLNLLRRRLAADPGSGELVDSIEAGVLQLGATLHSLLSFASGRKPKLQWVNVRQVVDSACALCRSQVHAQRVEIVMDVPSQLGVLADRDMLGSAILNLIANALDAMPRGGRLVITSFIGRAGFELEVADSGPGLSEEVFEQVFEPFFTTKNEGTGLGLAIVNRVAEMHGGEVRAANCPEGGAAFTLRLPQRARKAA
jgi:signal transduction histidine kinase